MRKTIEEAREALLRALPYFRHAIEQAKKSGSVKMGILLENSDGSGKVEMKFECEEFFNDIAIILDLPEQTADQTSRASALAFIQQHGLTVGRGGTK